MVADVEKYPALQHLSQFCPAAILRVRISPHALEIGQVWKTSKDGFILDALEVACCIALLRYSVSIGASLTNRLCIDATALTLFAQVSHLSRILGISAL
jgi:hypothetical protein